MRNVEPSLAATVVGVAGYQLLQLWNANAPSLSDVRSAHPDDHSVRQRLHDADYLVGGLTVILGVTFAVLTRDTTALMVMLVIFGSVSLWWHSVMNAPSL